VLSLPRFLGTAAACDYLPSQESRLEYELVARMDRREYSERLLGGWRRFGRTLFRPRCRRCAECQSLRVDAARFQPDRSQRRNRRANAGRTRLRIGPPAPTPEKLALYRRYHTHQSVAKGWPLPTPGPASYEDSFVNQPFPVEEWCFERDSRLVGVGYVDDLPIGLSAIYFFYDPDDRALGLGTWNILELIDQARLRELPHVYLGYYVADCPSLAYKARFGPNQTLTGDGTWRDFRA
jgi:arginine-tRNA-protein transferase